MQGTLLRGPIGPLLNEWRPRLARRVPPGFRAFVAVSVKSGEEVDFEFSSIWRRQYELLDIFEISGVASEKGRHSARTMQINSESPFP